MKKIKFKIEGMHCVSCAMSIDMDLEDLNGVINAKTNYAKSQTEVEFDEQKVNGEKIAEIINNIGYKAKPIN